MSTLYLPDELKNLAQQLQDKEAALDELWNVECRKAFDNGILAYNDPYNESRSTTVADSPYDKYKKLLKEITQFKLELGSSFAKYYINQSTGNF